MNERAIELYKQAAEFAYKTAGTDAGKGTIIESLTAGKFAELIVRECINKVENLSPGYDDYRTQIEDAFRRDCVEEIKQHFGVKE